MSRFWSGSKLGSIMILDMLILLGLTSYLKSVHGIDFPPNQHWFCAIATVVLWTASLSSTLFILSMTFDRFYSIIRPHKAASFNTVKRAKITIVSVVIISILYNIPFLYTVTNAGPNCVADRSETWKTVYHWLNYVVQFVIPFVSLLSTNSVIIHTLRKKIHVYNETGSEVRSRSRSKLQNENLGETNFRHITSCCLLFLYFNHTSVYLLVVHHVCGLLKNSGIFCWILFIL